MIRPDGRLRGSIEAFLLDQRSPHTRRSYGKDLKRFVQFLHGRVAGFGPEAISRSLIVSYKEYLLAEGLEHTTVDRHLSTLRSFFRWLVDDGVIEKNPAEGVRFLKPRRLSRTIGFSDEEVQRILKVPDLHTRTGSLHYAMLMVLFYCGLRRSELCELRTPNLGEERGQHVFRLRGKGNAERVVVVVPAVWHAIRHYFLIAARDHRVDAPLFAPIRNNRTGVRDKPLDPSQVFYVVTRYAKLAGISNRVSPHSCRATAISNARDHHVPDRAIQEFAGWTSTDMITRYDKRKTAVEDSAARSIAYGAEDRVPSGAEPKPVPQPERETGQEIAGPSPEKFLASLILRRP
jgi:site-specific recombinase XerD